MIPIPAIWFEMTGPNGKSIARKNLHVGMGHIEGTNSGLDPLEGLAAELQVHAAA